ncbi:hypothetical protein KKC45_01015 [Patescibacteria group bacterium]|nr:hypothetical protein [Patescibacteria group bacterium]
MVEGLETIFWQLVQEMSYPKPDFVRAELLANQMIQRIKQDDPALRAK